MKSDVASSRGTNTERASRAKQLSVDAASYEPSRRHEITGITESSPTASTERVPSPNLSSIAHDSSPSDKSSPVVANTPDVGANTAHVQANTENRSRSSGGISPVHRPSVRIEKLLDQIGLLKLDLNIELVKNQLILVLPQLLARPKIVERKNGARIRPLKHSKLKLLIFLKIVEKKGLV